MNLEYNIYIVTLWFWDGDSELYQEYIDCYDEHSDALNYAKVVMKDELRLIDYDETFEQYNEKGQYGSSSIVQIIRKKFLINSRSENKGVDMY